MFSDARRGYVSQAQTQTLLLSSTTAGNGTFVVPSGYSSFKVELVGGKGGSAVYPVGASDPNTGGLGAKSTFIVPFSDMAVGSSQSYTVGTSGTLAYGYQSTGANGTGTTFKGMLAGGGYGGSFNGDYFPDPQMYTYGANGTASGTVYTNTTPNQWASPASIKIWGIS